MAKQDTQKTEDTQSTNIITVSDAGPCKKKVTVEIPAETIHEKLDEKYKELRKDALIPGSGAHSLAGKAVRHRYFQAGQAGIDGDRQRRSDQGQRD